MLPINVFILCHNEIVLLPHTVAHYKKYMPSCMITICDNESTDGSVELAKSLGCNVITFSTNNIFDEVRGVYQKNNCWKYLTSGWVLTPDMDEWLCVTEAELNSEFLKGTTILNVHGYDMVGNSETADLSDVDLHGITNKIYNDFESKRLCFLRDEISEMNHGVGCHRSSPIGNIKYSSDVYINKHMRYPGLQFLINKLKVRYERTEDMRKKGWGHHYTNDISRIETEYKEAVRKVTIMYYNFQPKLSFLTRF